MRRILPLALILVVALGLGSWLFWSDPTQHAAAAPPKEQVRRPPSVTVVHVENREIAEEVRVSGSLVAREEIMVAPEIEGLAVTEILVEEGDRVTRGQVLARLSRTTLDAENLQADATIAQIEAQIAEAKASVVETAQALGRAETLRKSGTASASQYDQALSASQVAEARLNAAGQSLKVAQAQKQQIEVRLGRTEIKAPDAGVISRRTLRIGAISSMAGEPAFRIIQDGAVELQAEVVDATLARFKPDQVVRVTAAGRTEPVIGRIRLISPEIDPVTRLGRVRVALPDEPGLAIGAFASGVVEIGRKTALTLPISAISISDGRNTVQALVDNKVVTKDVETGLRAPTRVEIRSGLADGDMVVARAGSFLRVGDVVNPVEAEKEASR